MKQIPEIYKSSNSKEIFKKLELEISDLELELENVERELNRFQQDLRSALQVQIAQIHKLQNLYREQKKEKKEKRLMQKKKGKNYVESTKIVASKKDLVREKENLNSEKINLKRIYKESIVKVHPDKFSNENIEKQEKANALTVELNDLYQKGDLRELENLYDHIINGNAFTPFISEKNDYNNPEAMRRYLEHKREAIKSQLSEEKSSPLYFVLQNYKEPNTYIEELRIAFADRILKLEKRTRLKKQSK